MPTNANTKQAKQQNINGMVLRKKYSQVMSIATCPPIPELLIIGKNKV